jgi:hypothetical protein
MFQGIIFRHEGGAGLGGSGFHVFVVEGGSLKGKTMKEGDGREGEKGGREAIG